MINSTSLKMSLAKLTKQTVVTELTKTLYQADSVLVNQTNGGTPTVYEAFGIDATLAG